MGYVEKHLAPGEEVLLAAKMHQALWMLPFGQVLAMAVVIAASVFTILYFGSTGDDLLAGAALIPLAIAVVAAGNALVWIAVIPNHLGAYLGMQFVVTNKRIVRKYGFFGAEILELPLDKVETLTASQKSIWGRIFGYGQVQVHGMGGTSFGATHVANPVAFRNQAAAILEEAAARRQLG